MVTIKSVELTPFTLISSTVQAVLALIFAIIFLILSGIIGAFIPDLGAVIALLGVAALIIYPISTFFINLAVNFFSAFLYNGLVHRLGGVQIELEGSDLTEIPVVPFALILSVIGAIWAFILGLVLAAASAPLIALFSSGAPVISEILTNITTAANATAATIPTASQIGAFGGITAVVLIIGLPIAAFIFGFIGNALFAIFYNYIATRVSKLKLEFEVAEGLQQLVRIPVVPAALSIAIVFTIFGVIQGILDLISLSVQGDPVNGVITLIVQIIAYFVLHFIVVAIAAWAYNFLVPKIGGIKLELD